jgi:hypothetical protein
LGPIRFSCIPVILTIIPHVIVLHERAFLRAGLGDGALRVRGRVRGIRVFERIPAALRRAFLSDEGQSGNDGIHRLASSRRSSWRWSARLDAL